MQPMGWRCEECGEQFEHGRILIDHWLAEHPDEARVVVEAGLRP